jgi:hypothetical protein
MNMIAPIGVTTPDLLGPFADAVANEALAAVAAACSRAIDEIAVKRKVDRPELLAWMALVASREGT